MISENGANLCAIELGAVGRGIRQRNEISDCVQVLLAKIVE